MLSSKFKIVPLLSSANITAGVDTDSINMKNYHRATLIVVFGPSLSGNSVLTLYDGASDGSKANALTFRYRYGSAAIKSATADTLSTLATSAALTATGTTYVSRMLIIDIQASQMADGYPFLTLQFGANTAGECSVVAILEPRYQGNTIPSAIPAT